MDIWKRRKRRFVRIEELQDNMFASRRKKKIHFYTCVCVVIGIVKHGQDKEMAESLFFKFM